MSVLTLGLSFGLRLRQGLGFGLRLMLGLSFGLRLMLGLSFGLRLRLGLRLGLGFGLSLRLGLGFGLRLRQILWHSAATDTTHVQHQSGCEKVLFVLCGCVREKRRPMGGGEGWHYTSLAIVLN
uniref:Uncharacterized protein n=1 Tax=Astyanax mexicanus TaxID=7994 RepID=A0A3B1JJY2_ASTMX